VAPVWGMTTMQSEDHRLASGLGITAIFLAILAVVLAVVRGQLPRWQRIMLVSALFVVAAGTGFYAYYILTKPKQLTVAVGSYDGQAVQFMTSLAARFASTNAPIRLKVVDKGTPSAAAKAFNSGEVASAVVRPDHGDMSVARTVATITYGTVLILTPPGSPIKKMEDLKGKTLGLVGGEENRRLSQAISAEFDLPQAGIKFVDVAPADIPAAVQAARVDAFLAVVPISERYLNMLRALLPSKDNNQPGLVPIDAAAAIAAVSRAYQSYTLPKGTIRGSPPMPAEDMTTLRIPFHLVVDKKADDDMVASLAKAIMETRRDLLAEHPLLAQIGAPDSDKNAFIPIHPGAASYYNGEQQGFLDKYGDALWYGSMVLGLLTSLFAGLWRFVSKDETPEPGPLTRLYGLMDSIDTSQSEADLIDIERRLDVILRKEFEKYENGAGQSQGVEALGLATHRLEQAISRRRSALGGGLALADRP